MAWPTEEQKARYAADQKLRNWEKAAAAGRTPGRIGRPPKLTPEEKLQRRKERARKGSRRQVEKLKATRLAKAIAEGRIPGESGRAPRYTPEERDRRRRETFVKHNAKYRDKRRATWRAYRKKKLAAKAIAEGRTPGVVGGEPRLSKQERIARTRARSLAYWEKNPEKRKELGRQYYEGHKDEVQANCRNRRARVQKAPGTHTAADIKLLMQRQKGKCAFCLQPFGKEKPHVDHYVPIILGGSNDPGNLRLLHPKCNLVKAGKDPAEFARKNGLLCW